MQPIENDPLIPGISAYRENPEQSPLITEEAGKAKILEEVMEKVGLHEDNFKKIFEELNAAADSYRMIAKQSNKDKTQSLFNSKSGETNRAANTLGSLWQRMMTADDAYIEAVAEGYDWLGREYTEEELFGVEALHLKQQERLHYKENLFVGAKSCGLFGSALAELNWVQSPTGLGEKTFEGTEFNPRPMLTSGFDPFTTDIRKSDWVHFFDFPSKFQLQAWAASDTEGWDGAAIKEAMGDQKNGNFSKTDAYNRVIYRKNRAGYTVSNPHVFELLTYRGKLDPENPVLQKIWQDLGGRADIRFVDWKVRILNSHKIVAITPCFGGDWHHEVKVANFNKFELESIGYGIGRVGRKMQAELDFQQTLLNNLATATLYHMMKVSRDAHVKQNQLQFKPWNLIELDDIKGLEPLGIDVNAIAQTLNLMAGTREDFRTTTGATANLQALATKATATESTLTQTEAIRGGSVAAELIADNFVREFFESAHLYNLAYLDAPIWVSVAGTKKPMFYQYSKANLPRSVGFRIKCTTDKDYRPEKADKLLQFMQMATSLKQILPNGVNVMPFFEEWARTIGINPRRLKQPYPVADQMLDAVRRRQALGNMDGGGGIGAEIGAEMGGGDTGNGFAKTPKGIVPTSPITPRLAGLE